MKLDKEKVMQFIPHRDPFLFIDSVESIIHKDWEFGKGVIDPKNAQGGVVTAHYHAKESLEIFNGHFPGKPVLPGVIQVEMMAQASSFVMAFFHPDPFGEDTLDVALTSVSGAKFRRPVLPGMKLKITSECVKYRKPIIVCDCKVYHDDNLMSEATILASIRY